MQSTKMPVYWKGKAPVRDSFGQEIEDEFVDGKTRQGPWAIMTPQNWRSRSITRDNSLGRGIGQRYKRQPDGRWLKVEG